MAKYRVYGKVVGTKYIGVYEGNTKEEAENKAYKDSSISLCHYCAEEISDPQIEELILEEITVDGE